MKFVAKDMRGVGGSYAIYQDRRLKDRYASGKTDLQQERLPFI